MSKKEPPGRSLVTVVSTLPAEIAAQDKQQRTLATVVSKLPAELAAKDAALHGKTRTAPDHEPTLDGDDAVIVEDDELEAEAPAKDVEADEEEVDDDDDDGARESIDSLDVGDVTRAEPITPATLEVPAAVREETEPVDGRKARRAAPGESRKFVGALVIAVLGGVGVAYMMTRETTKASSSRQPATHEKWVAHDAGVVSEEPAAATDAAVANVTPPDATTPNATTTTPVDAGVAPPRNPPTGSKQRTPRQKNWDPDTLFPP